jgi:hypothetical protein
MAALIDPPQIPAGLPEYDDARSIDVRQAAKMLRGRGGRREVSPAVLRRWCRDGCTIQGERLWLPCVRISGEFRLMEEWVVWFEKERIRLGMRRPAPRLARPERSRAAAHRRAEEFLRREGV